MRVSKDVVFDELVNRYNYVKDSLGTNVKENVVAKIEN